MRFTARCSLLLLLLTTFACEGSMEDHPRQDATRDMATADASALPDTGGASEDMEGTTRPDQGGDQGESRLPAMLRIERDGATVAPGATLTWEPAELGAQAVCHTLKLYNTGDEVLPLDVALSEGPFVLAAAAPASLEGMASQDLELCLETTRAFAGEVTLTLTSSASLTLAAQVVAPTPLLAVGPQRVQRSEDRGQSWSEVARPAGLEVIHGALWADGAAWLFGEGSAPLWKSEDGGASWSVVALDAGIVGLSGLAYQGGKFMGVHGRDIIHSSDGVSWTRVADTVDEGSSLRDIAWGSGRFVAVGEKMVAISTDGESWEKRRGWELTSSRIVSDGATFAKNSEDHYLQLSTDGEMWQTYYQFCDVRESAPSLPVFATDRGVMFASCDHTLRARSLEGSWRQVGKIEMMPEPMLYAHDILHGVDSEGRFVFSEHGLDWSVAQGDATGVTEMIVLAAPGEATVAPPAPAACEDGALRCIGFEQERAGLPPLFQLDLKASKMATVAIDDQFAYSGTRSMRVEVPQGSGGSGMIRFKGDDFAPQLADVIHGRMMFFTAAYPVRNWHMSESSGPLNEQNMTNIQYNAGGNADKAFHNYYGNGADCWNNAEYAYPVNRWFCWQVAYDRANNTMVISVDGEEVHRMDGMGDGCLGGMGKDTVWQAPMAFTQFTLGYNPFKTQEQDLTAWIDDVAISDKPIPCPPAP